jgi:hypothetical protein
MFFLWRVKKNGVKTVVFFGRRGKFTAMSIFSPLLLFFFFSSFDPDVMKQIENTKLDDLKDQKEENSFEARDLNFSERFEKWIVSQTHCSKFEDNDFDLSKTKGSGGRYYQNSGQKLNKSFSTPSFVNSSKSLFHYLFFLNIMTFPLPGLKNVF